MLKFYCNKKKTHQTEIFEKLKNKVAGFKIYKEILWF